MFHRHTIDKEMKRVGAEGSWSRVVWVVAAALALLLALTREVAGLAAPSSGGGGAGAKKPNKVVARNRQATRIFEIIDRMEAGVQLQGTEVKSIRLGKCSIDESFAQAKQGQLTLHGMYIAPHTSSHAFYQHETKRPRRLLMHKQEIRRLEAKCAQQGMTIIPLSAYFNHNNLLKLTLGLAKGKNTRDKRDDIRKKDEKREIGRAIKSFR